MKYLVTMCVVAILLSPSIVLSETPEENRKATALRGAGLLEVCTSTDPEIMSFCHGYVQGVHDAYVDEICVPSSVTRAQIAEAAVSMLRSNEEARGLYAGAVVYAVLLRSFPCSE